MFRRENGERRTENGRKGDAALLDLSASVLSVYSVVRILRGLQVLDPVSELTTDN